MKIGFKAEVKKFSNNGEKTGWTYIIIPNKIAQKINPGNKKSFRVKGKLDDHQIKSVALLPMGDGDFIMAINAVMRKAIKKQKGATLVVEIEKDNVVLKISEMLLTCLTDDKIAKDFFKTLAPSHQQYFSKWIESAKSDETKTKRVALALNALSNKLSFSLMIRMQQKNKIIQ